MMDTETCIPQAAGILPAVAGGAAASLICRVAAAFDAGAAATAPERIAAELAKSPDLELPFDLRRPGGQKYARRLIHRDEERDLVLIAMVWSPGHGAPVHDHGGYWCIEQVLAGRLGSDIYRIEEERGGLLRLAWQQHEEQEQGAIAVLRPPVEAHSIANRGSETAITLNVYGGELKRCRVFQPLENGWYQPAERQLGYDD